MSLEGRLADELFHGFKVVLSATEPLGLKLKTTMKVSRRNRLCFPDAL